MKEKLTLERAKELSDKKWTLIFNKEIIDEDDSIDELPELNNMENNCAMCEYRMQQGKECDGCLYYNVCGKPFENWYGKQSKENAFVMVTEIRKINNHGKKKA